MSTIELKSIEHVGARLSKVLAEACNLRETLPATQRAHLGTVISDLEEALNNARYQYAELREQIQEEAA